jgi:hypothetical protein
MLPMDRMKKVKVTTVFEDRMDPWGTPSARSFALLLAALLIGSGCANRMPLKSLPESRRAGLHLVGKAEGEVKVRTESARGRNARQNGGTGGLIGIAVSEWVAGSTKAGNKPLLRRLREHNGYPEQAALDFAFRLQLNKAGLDWTEQAGEPTLALRLDAVGLQEMQRGYWRVHATVTGTLTDVNQKTIWTAEARACSSTLRSLEEFSREPEIYADDFRDAAEDATRQLVAGPIR